MSTFFPARPFPSLRLPRHLAPLAAAVATAAALAPGASAVAAEPQWTPLTASVAAAPQAVRATDGHRHLAYEIDLHTLQLLSETAPVEVQSLDVRAQGGRSLLKLNPSEFVMTSGVPAEVTNTLAPGLSGTVWLDVTLPGGQKTPRALVHRLRVRAEYPSGARTFTFDTARTRVIRRSPVKIAPPLRGGTYMNFNGCCELGPHRTGRVSVDGGLHLPQRFANDYLEIDEHGNGYTGDVARNENWFGYLDPVHAVADGVVVSTRNNMPENTPPIEPLIENFTPDTDRGNSVVMRLSNGRYVLYGHLHTGSVRVKPGQRVRAGQVLGRMGNTGASGAPHLHLDISDSPRALEGNGLPFVYDRFRNVGSVTNLDEWMESGLDARVSAVSHEKRRGEYPLQATVLDFPR